MIDVSMYQPRIPISGGGGHIDLRERAGENPIVAALEKILERKRQQKQDELTRRATETDIAYRQKQTGLMGQEKPRQGKIVMAGDKALLIDPTTGETIKEIPMPPESGRRILEELAKIGTLPKGTIPAEAETGLLGSLLQELLGKRGLEEYEETIPGKKQSLWGIDQLWPDRPPRTETRYRKKAPETGKRKKVKERPPKPAEYPNAKWSEEHQMWTIIKNGRLMGVK